MTKKFWKDWQNRIGETKDIWLFSRYHSSTSYSSYVLNTNDRLIKATFYGDTVDLIIERHNQMIDWNTRSLKHHVENEYLTLHRNEIETVEFIKREHK